MTALKFLFLIPAITIVTSLPVGATIVSGRVTDDAGAGVFDVDLDFIDRSTGESIPLANDDTDILGFYAVSVPTGDYDVRFKPAPGVAITAHEERGVRALVRRRASDISSPEALAHKRQHNHYNRQHHGNAEAFGDDLR